MRWKAAFYLGIILPIMSCLIIPTIIWAAPLSPATNPEERVIHGSLDTYKGNGIALVWGILKNPEGKSPETDRVVLRIKATSKDWEALRVEGIDPFSSARSTVFSALFPLVPLDILLPRAHFDSFPRTEIHFFQSYRELQESKPHWILYFVGVPDTTPEFLSLDQLMDHLAKALITPPR